MEVFSVWLNDLEQRCQTRGPWHDCQHAMWPPGAHEFDTSDLECVILRIRQDKKLGWFGNVREVEEKMIERIENAKRFSTKYQQLEFFCFCV